MASVGGAWPGCGGVAEESRAFWDGFRHQWLPLVRLKSLTSSPPMLSIPLTLSTPAQVFCKDPSLLVEMGTLQGGNTMQD